MAQPVGDTGQPLAAHIRQAQETAEKHGIKLEGLEIAEDANPGTMPPGFLFIFEAFIDLSSSRQVGWVPCPISYSDIDSWQRVNQVCLHVWEVDLIKRLDGAWLKVTAEQQRSKE